MITCIYYPQLFFCLFNIHFPRCGYLTIYARIQHGRLTPDNSPKQICTNKDRPGGWADPQLAKHTSKIGQRSGATWTGSPIVWIQHERLTSSRSTQTHDSKITTAVGLLTGQLDYTNILIYTNIQIHYTNISQNGQSSSVTETDSQN